jgi:hypothetical protein
VNVEQGCDFVMEILFVMVKPGISERDLSSWKEKWTPHSDDKQLTCQILPQLFQNEVRNVSGSRVEICTLSHKQTGFRCFDPMGYRT